MNPDDMKPNSGNLFYSTDGENWKPIGEVQNLHLIELVEISCTIELSEEEAVRLLNLIDPEPLEIVKRE